MLGSMPFRRRTLLIGPAAATLGRASDAMADSMEEDDASWTAFKVRFLTADGRVTDTGNADASHTEGQGWGMLFATSFGDREAFDRIDTWTRRTLARPNDALHIWRYQPRAANKTNDPNNATDGDLFIAAALVRAAQRWNRPELRARATAIARSVLALLVRPLGGLTLLAPGADGFSRAEGLIVNPSYYAFFALDELAHLLPDPAWARLRQDGITLLGRARFGAWQLPPDWALVAPDGSVALAPDQKPQFGYDAVRVPLYLAWAGIDSPVLGSVASWWRHGSPPPAWVDLQSGASAGYAAGPGMAAAMQLAAGEDAPIPGTAPDMDYYTAALCLLARVARRDITARRTAAGPR